jgi:hypothetical protein
MTEPRDYKSLNYGEVFLDMRWRTRILNLIFQKMAVDGGLYFALVGVTQIVA